MLKIARLPSRYHYFLDTTINVYSSNGYVKPSQSKIKKH